MANTENMNTDHSFKLEKSEKTLALTLPGKFLVLMGGLFAASLPWVFIKTIPGASNFYLLQPLALMFVTYPAIYIAAGVASQLVKIRMIWSWLICLISFVLVISIMIAFTASLYFVFYSVFMLIGYWVAGSFRNSRQKPAGQ